MITVVITVSSRFPRKQQGKCLITASLRGLKLEDVIGSHEWNSTFDTRMLAAFKPH